MNNEFLINRVKGCIFLTILTRSAVTGFDEYKLVCAIFNDSTSLWKSEWYPLPSDLSSRMLRAAMSQKKTEAFSLMLNIKTWAV